MIAEASILVKCPRRFILFAFALARLSIDFLIVTRSLWITKPRQFIALPVTFPVFRLRLSNLNTCQFSFNSRCSSVFKYPEIALTILWSSFLFLEKRNILSIYRR